jgi:hypothetical protein
VTAPAAVRQAIYCWLRFSDRVPTGYLHRANLRPRVFARWSKERDWAGARPPGIELKRLRGAPGPK